MGLGHIYRCMAIAEMVRPSYQVIFIIKGLTSTVSDIVKSSVDSTIDLDPAVRLDDECNFLATQIELNNALFILDGYHFEAEYQLQLKRKKAKVICIDDIHSTFFHSDYVINHAGGIKDDQYSMADYTSLFIGPKYAIVRNQFLTFATEREYPSTRDSLFICLGGADPKNDTLSILQACEDRKYGKHIFLVIGPAFLHQDQLAIFLEKSSLQITLLSQLNASEMLKYMSMCDEAITPPSTISFEYMMVGGVLYLKKIADNQNSINNYFLEEGFAIEYDTSFPLNDKKTKSELISKQHEVFDGKSGDRILALINQLTIQ